MRSFSHSEKGYFKGENHMLANGYDEYRTLYINVPVNSVSPPCKPLTLQDNPRE